MMCFVFRAYSGPCNWTGSKWLSSNCSCLALGLVDSMYCIVSGCVYHVRLYGVQYSLCVISSSHFPNTGCRSHFYGFTSSFLFCFVVIRGNPGRL